MKKIDLQYDIYNPAELDFPGIIRKYFNTDDIKESKFLIKVDLHSGLKSIQSGSGLDVDIVDEFIHELNKYGPVKIFIADSENKEDMEALFKEHGYFELSSKYSNVELLNLSNHPFVSYLGFENSKFRNLDFNEILLKVDFFVNFACLKSNIAEIISGCYMSLLDYNADSGQKVQFQSFSKYLAFDLFQMFTPSFCLLDAGIILGSMGPVEGFPKQMNKIIVGSNPVVVDSVALKILGIDFMSVPTLKYAIKKLRISGELKKSLDRVKAEEISLERVPKFHFLIFRFSFLINRISAYLNNFAYFVFLGGLALISIGGKDLVSGKLMSFNNYYKLAREIILKVSKPDDLLNWKIAINKHVKEKSLS